jgi:AraC-like DNA-binding protein
VTRLHRARCARHRAARLATIEHDIARHIGCEELTADWVARRHGVSASHVRRLFAGVGTTFSRFVLDARLKQAERILRDPRERDRTVSAIAFDLGFGDLSYFNRTFRRKFRVVPSAMRIASAADALPATPSPTAERQRNGDPAEVQSS